MEGLEVIQFTGDITPKTIEETKKLNYKVVSQFVLDYFNKNGEVSKESLKHIKRMLNPKAIKHVYIFPYKVSKHKKADGFLDEVAPRFYPFCILELTSGENLVVKGDYKYHIKRIKKTRKMFTEPENPDGRIIKPLKFGKIEKEKDD